MPNTKSAAKRVRSSERKRIRNRRWRTQARTYIKRTRRLIAAGRLDEAAEACRLAEKTLDKAAVKGIIHPNNAARHKSRLMRQLETAKQAD